MIIYKKSLFCNISTASSTPVGFYIYNKGLVKI